MEEDVTLENTQPDTPIQRFKNWWHNLTKRKKVIITVMLVGLVVAGSVGAYWSTRDQKRLNSKHIKPDTPGVDVVSPAEPEVKKVLPLDGVEVTQKEYDEVMKYLPMAVMVENLWTVRPVSGLSRADLVFEALAEGGITRYMAVFHHHDVEEIMPVRSARSYYMDWLKPIDASYMHIGGAVSSDPRASALPRIASEGIKSYMNVYGSWWRRNDRAAPHNAFTSTGRMKDAQNKLGWATEPTIQMWNYKDELEEDQRPEAEVRISLNWYTWGENRYSVDWVYDPVGNRYFYEVGGVRQTDPATGDDVTTKNIIIQLTPMSQANDGSGRVVYNTIGEGRALVFRDGQVIEGTWKKPNLETRTRFYDENNEEVGLNRGRTWVQVAPDNSEVVY